MAEQKTKDRRITVILMTYGSPKTLDDIPDYLRNVYHGKDASDETIKEFTRRYSLIGGSPLVRITQNQAEALDQELHTHHKEKGQFSVDAGMRFSEPFIKDVVQGVAIDADTIIGIIMSPQYSPILMKGYVDALQDAVQLIKRPELKLKIIKGWHLEPLFLQAIAQRVKEAIEKLQVPLQETIPVLLTAHSMPRRVVETEASYINALQETAEEVAKLAGLTDSQWQFCYQSAGHTKEEWLRPDFADLMPQLKSEGASDVLIAPIQFLSDHLEILYDIEIGAREEAERYGIVFHRTESLNTSPLFIKALAHIVISSA